ncbi:MAG: flagellar hook protein FlgE, partial [Octadecabacter sp.]
MTISSSLNASVAGLASNASRLATISDNIANSSTYGYKRAETDFHSMVINSGQGTYSAGGVRATTQRLVDERGALVSTSNPTDLAVSGGGMLPLTQLSAIEADDGDVPFMLGTTGSFRANADGYLTSETGLVLLGWPTASDGSTAAFPRDTIGGLEPVQLNSNSFLGNATTEMSISVNLPATDTEETGTGDSHEMSVEYYDNLGIAQTLTMTFTPSVPAAGDAPTNEWNMTMADSASAGAVVGEYTVVFDEDRGAGGQLLSVTAVTGDAYDAAEGSVTVDVNGGPMEINIGVIGEAGGLSQLSDIFVPIDISKNGSPVGNLLSVEVDANGFVNAYYDNGVTQSIYQVPLVDVSNVNGLQTLDNQAYVVTPESGSFYLHDAGSGPTGEI